MSTIPTDVRRLFFGAHVRAPWRSPLPKGRILPEEARHITLAFLGNTSFTDLEKILPFFPRPLSPLGQAGIGKELVFLPKNSPRVAASTVFWPKEIDHFLTYQKHVSGWLHSHNYPEETRPFFPHITLARSPFIVQEWMDAFCPFAFFISGIHLFESLGNLTYRSLWNLPLLAPFEDLDHIADLAFLIRGSSIQEIHFHAQIALSFHHPELVSYFTSKLEDSLDRVIISLNEMITRIDSEQGSPFKAVSFHGKIIETPTQLLSWEMIVDV